MTGSVRAAHWNLFAVTVQQHIDTYAVPQYGDYPNDQIEEFTVEDFKVNMKRYINRMSSNSRGSEESIRDCIKIAHYAQMLYRKLMNEKENDSA